MRIKRFKQKISRQLPTEISQDLCKVVSRQSLYIGGVAPWLAAEAAPTRNSYTRCLEPKYRHLQKIVLLEKRLPLSLAWLASTLMQVRGP